MNKTIVLLQIARTKGIGAIKMRAILQKYSPLKALDLLSKRFQVPTYEKISIEYKKTINFGANFLFCHEKLFPDNVYASVLVYKGNIKLLKEKKIIAIVGARKVTIEGDLFCRKILIYNKKIVSISGLAIGVDTIVHQLSYKTIGVIGTGINVYYPRQNKILQQNISVNGLILTEFAYDEPAKQQNFLRRNRIISAIANKTLIIEAGIKSGSLSTAKFSIAFKKKVYVVPGHPLKKEYAGNNYLLTTGAIPFIAYDSYI